MLKCYPGDIVGVTFKGHDRIRVGGFDVVESDDMSACSGKVSFVWGNRQAIDL